MKYLKVEESKRKGLISINGLELKSSEINKPLNILIPLRGKPYVSNAAIEKELKEYIILKDKERNIRRLNPSISLAIFLPRRRLARTSAVVFKPYSILKRYMVDNNISLR